ncbi:phage portal protein [Salmonella enterica subsp. enterica serovar Virchow]|nr:phage portal protein [Salmonella enterica subsp. enterica serovar Virchow]
MGIFDIFRRSASAPSERQALGETVYAYDTYTLTDPLLVDFMRGGAAAITGQPVNVENALRNPSMFRAVALLSGTVGMLPLHLLKAEDGEKAKEHPLYRVLHRRPNTFQSAFDFKSFMQMQAVTRGDGFAYINWSKDLSTGRRKIRHMVPLEYERVNASIGADWVPTYTYDAVEGGKRKYAAHEILHLRGLTKNGFRGISLVQQARDAIAIAIASELATGRLFKNGVLGSSALKHPKRLSLDAYNRLQASLESKSGAENAGKTLILEEGMDWLAIDKSAKDSQLTELRKLQIEEIARVTGVPRPLLMVDETSWGSGIEALGQFFIAYALNPWFEAWQQAIERSLLVDGDEDLYVAKFNPGALLRGSLKDQAEYLSKALGAGGHQPWMWADEARDVMDLPKRAAPPNQMMGHNGGPPLDPNEDTK